MKKQEKQKRSASPTSAKLSNSEHRKGTSSDFFLTSWVARNSFLVAVGLVFSLILIIYHDFLFANLYYLFKDIGSDSLNMTYPSLVHITEYLKKEGFPLWSFSQGMGQSVANSMNDPFTWIVYLAGSENVAYSIIWMEVVKIIITAIVFYHFLTYWNFSHYTTIIGTILYSFSGFIVIGSGWSLFSTEACYLALLLLGFEMLYQKGNWYLFPVAVFLIAILQPFDLYLYGLFLSGYFLLRHFTSSDPSMVKFFRFTGKLLLFGFLGLLMSSFFLVFFIQIIIDSPRVGGSASYYELLSSRSMFFTETAKYYLTAVLRLFHNDVLGNGIKYYGWYNYLEAPLFYIGLFPLILLPQVFFLEDKRKVIGYAVFFIVILILLIFPFFRYAIWLFTGDYFRGFSLFLSVPILLFGLSAFSALDNGKKINPYVLGITAASLLVILYFPYQNASQIIRGDIQGTIRNFIIIYTVILFFFMLKRYNHFIGLALILFVVFETGYFNYQTIRERDVLTNLEVKQKTGYNDYTVEAVKYLKSSDKQFYRINKSYTSGPAMHASLNDAKAQGFFGTRSYSSFNQKYYIRFLEEMKIIKKGNETMSRWSSGLTTRPLLQHFASTKYQLIQGSVKPSLNVLYDSVTMFGDVKVFRNKNFLPLGYTYDSIIRLSDFSKLSPLVKEVVIQKNCVVDDSITQLFGLFPSLLKADTTPNYTLALLSADVLKRKSDTLTITRFTENQILGKIEPKSRKLLFFSIPYDRGWHGRIDGKEVNLLLCNIGFIGLVVEPGSHQIELFYRPPYFYASLLVSIVGILIYIVAVIIVMRLKKRTSVVSEPQSRKL